LITQCNSSQPEIKEKEAKEKIEELKEEAVIAQLKYRDTKMAAELKAVKITLNQEYIEIYNKNAKLIAKQKKELEDKDTLIKQLEETLQRQNGVQYKRENSLLDRK
jgi:tRNA A37 N6-isopentenylltransferase MiaA